MRNRNEEQRYSPCFPPNATTTSDKPPRAAHTAERIPVDRDGFDSENDASVDPPGETGVPTVDGNTQVKTGCRSVECPEPGTVTDEPLMG